MTPDEAVMGSGLVGAGPVPDGSGEGSASAPEVLGPITPPTGGNVARLEDDVIMARFVRDYLGLLDERVATITAQLEPGNDLTANISLLSLESTSSMVGAKELASIAGLLRGAVERKQMHLVPALVLAMTNEAVKVQQQLGPAD